MNLIVIIFYGWIDSIAILQIQNEVGILDCVLCCVNVFSMTVRFQLDILFFY